MPRDLQPSDFQLARFYHHPQRNNNGSFKDVVFIEIRIKGDKNTSFSRPKTDEDELDFPRAWRAFLANNPESIDGTPLAALPMLGQSDVLNLMEMGIRTIEDVAKISDEQRAELENGDKIVIRAKAYLKALADIEEMEAELKRRAAEDDQIDWVDDQPAPAQDTPRRRGRPRKVQA